MSGRCTMANRPTVWLAQGRAVVRTLERMAPADPGDCLGSCNAATLSARGRDQSYVVGAAVQVCQGRVPDVDAAAADSQDPPGEPRCVAATWWVLVEERLARLAVLLVLNAIGRTHGPGVVAAP
jgi:hypothetical protein